MFSSEIQEVKESLKNSLDIFNKMKYLESEYKALEKKLYIDFYSRTYINSIYNEAIKQLSGCVTDKTGLKSFSLKECSFSDNYIEILNESVKKVETVNNQTILDEFKGLIKTRYSYEKKERYSINGDTIELQADCDYYLKILLNVLNILINNKVESHEIYEKCRKVMRDNQTFIYRNIKITGYKNGKTKLVFGCNDLKNKFIKELIND